MTGSTSTCNGTPDVYYDGPRCDLWVEYKQLDCMPRSGIVCCAPAPGVKKQPKGHLTALQLAWITRRWHVDQNAFVIVGLPNKRAILQLNPVVWARGSSIHDAKPLEDIATWIRNFCGA